MTAPAISEDPNEAKTSEINKMELSANTRIMSLSLLEV